MINKPCLLYATDIEEYDRGYYFKFDRLPFPLARNQQELSQAIMTFDHKKYGSDVTRFLDDEVGMFEDGNASRRIAEWMSSNSL